MPKYVTIKLTERQARAVSDALGVVHEVCPIYISSKGKAALREVQANLRKTRFWELNRKA